jgi:hypothetical protein
MTAGYFALAVVAGAADSPLTVALPAGAHPPSWATHIARGVGLDSLGRGALTAVAWVLVPVVIVAFAGVLYEAWARSVRLSAIFIASAISLSISVAAPLLLSRDVYTYAAYGRIDAVDHRNPYVATMASYPHDPFVSVASAQWHHTHSLYGPLFTLASAAIARTWAGSPGATILAFKLVTGLAIAAATGLAALAALRTRPDRAPLAAALVGLNPVIVVHTVGGAHVDALIAAPLGAASAIAVMRPRPASTKAMAVTLLLTIACLVKAVVVPALALWLVWIARSAGARRGRTLIAHAALVAASVLAASAPFLAGWRTLAPFATLGGIESWASPSHLVGRGAQAIAGSLAGSNAGVDAAHSVEVAFLALFVVLLWRMTRLPTASDAARQPAAWGAALLLLALSMPYLLPWYAAWFAPLLALLADRVLLAAGALATAVLALTLIPADPFHGLSSPGVMYGVHYGAASALLVVLVVATARVSGNRDGSTRALAPTGSGTAPTRAM